MPLVSGPIRRVVPIEAQDAAFFRRHSTRPVQLTLPGRFTMTPSFRISLSFGAGAMARPIAPDSGRTPAATVGRPPNPGASDP